MTCVDKEYEVKIKMVYEKWLQLEMKHEDYYLVGRGIKYCVCRGVRGGGKFSWS